MEASKLFVCLMGMGVTFLGLGCIIVLTLLMGKVMGAAGKKEEPRKAAPVPAPVPAAPAAPAVPADGVTDEVKVAILAALAQEPGFRMGSAARIDIRRL